MNAQDNRPLSPHLSVYRWQISNTLSILHRMTGFALTIGSLLFAAWLWAAAYDAELFELLYGFFTSIVGKLFLFGWTVAFFYHFGNGLRHLMWDTGAGLAVPQVNRSGIAVLAFTVLATGITWWFALSGGIHG